MSAVEMPPITLAGNQSKDIFSRFTALKPLMLVGCGRMGAAMLDGWLQSGLSPAATVIVEPSEDIRATYKDRAGLLVGNISEIPSGLVPQIVVLAVKPQMMDGAVQSLTHLADEGAAFLSVAAGKSLAYFREYLGAAPVVRAMPNTPAAIGHGITAAISNDAVTSEIAEIAEALLSTVGAFVWLEDERHMDAVTAVSGSGPAYLFYLTECLAAAGAAAGLPPELSFQLAVHTMSGSGALLAASGDSPAALREAVTSPAGTTAAALDVLMGEKGLSPLMRQAVMAATKRSRELGQSN